MTTKTLATVAVSLITGIVIGVAATFKAADKKANKKIEDELAEMRRSMRESSSDKEGVTDFKEVREKDKPADEKIEEVAQMTLDDYEDIAQIYSSCHKPFILDDVPGDFDDHEIASFSQIEVVFDTKCGRAGDEDGNEIFDIKGTLGFNNLKRIREDYGENTKVSVVCERDEAIYIVHIGNIEEFVDDEEGYVDE